MTFFVFFFHMQMWTKAPFLAPMRGEYEELWRPAVASLFKVRETEKGRLCTTKVSYPDEFFTTNQPQM